MTQKKSIDISDTEIDAPNDTEDLKSLENIEPLKSDELEPALNDFEQKIEALSLDELNVEREQFDDMVEGLSTEQLEEMKEQLQSGNQDMLDIWGLHDDVADSEDDAKY